MKQLLRKSTFLLAALLMMTSCGVQDSDSTRVQPSGNLQVRCPDLAEPVVGQSQEGYTGYVIDEYHKCAAKDDGLLAGFDVMSYFSSSAWGDVLNQHKQGGSNNISLSGASQVH